MYVSLIAISIEQGDKDIFYGSFTT